MLGVSDVRGATTGVPGAAAAAHSGGFLRGIQATLETFYGLERAADVVEFVALGEPGGRERVLLRPTGDALECRVELPRRPEDPRRHADWRAQLIEGVSHFVFLAERARAELPATHLELELQAEVDKFVVLLARAPRAESAARRVHADLFELPRFVDAAGSELGTRYRLAHRLAAGYLARLASRPGVGRLQRELRRFYRAGQSEKLHLARAA